MATSDCVDCNARCLIDWLVATHVKDADGKLALSKLRISFTDDLDLSELRHEWRDAVKLQTTVRIVFKCTQQHCTIKTPRFYNY